MAEEIFLSIERATAPVPFLSIPCSDIERLAVSPFRWIRYVMFAICGAPGDLLTLNGSPVDYDTKLVDAKIKYNFQPSEDCAFVDHEGLNDRLTTTAKTTRSKDFRDAVIKRDGPYCVVTEKMKARCQAAHLIPHSKGEDYIAKVIQLRSARDGSVPPPLHVEIDDKLNGILLSRTLHSELGLGEVAFIKTPNYGLGPEDVKRFHRGDSRTDYITLQWLKKPQGYDPTLLTKLQTLQNGIPNISPAILLEAGANLDALFQGNGEGLPSTVILDYVYGVAAYRSWLSDHADVATEMRNYRELHYAKIPLLPLAPDDSEDDTSASDDSSDSNYKPVEPRRGYNTGRRHEGEMAKAMDELNMILMYVSGTTPEEATERRQTKIEQEERAAQEASTSKVMEWMNHLDIY